MGKQSWTSEVSFENETVLVFALKEQDVAEYHYRLYRRLAGLVAEKWAPEASASFKAMIREELNASVHGEVDDESWKAKQNLVRRQANLKRESPLLEDYMRQSFIDTLTLYLHGICCDIDVETGPTAASQPLSTKAPEPAEDDLPRARRLRCLSRGCGAKKVGRVEAAKLLTAS